jgi:hypothetical protein
MKIVFNSDMLFADSLIKDELPRHVSNFLQACRGQEHEIIIPLTTLLEFNRKQKEEVFKEVSYLNDAINKLAFYGLNVNDFKPSDIVKAPDLIQLINAMGISCILKEPIKEDYENAHRKACLKETPHPPDIKSDEMRDLVIWEISLRIAKQFNGAILMSKDKVHIHHRGDKEASEHGLIRCNSFERAKESLGMDTVSAQKIRNLINNVLTDIIASNLPIISGGYVISITNPIFINKDDGTSKVECKAIFNSGDGKTIKSTLFIEFINDHPYLLHFNDIIIDGTQSFEDVKVDRRKPITFETDMDERFRDLKDLIEG